MLFFWNHYSNSKLATFVSILASFFLFPGVFMLLGGIVLLIQGDLDGLPGIPLGGVSLAVFFLLRKAADWIAYR